MSFHPRMDQHHASSSMASSSSFFEFSTSRYYRNEPYHQHEGTLGTYNINPAFACSVLFSSILNWRMIALSRFMFRPAL